jgi:hypothetical protein
MKNHRISFRLLFITLILLVVGAMSCKKNSVRNDEPLLGTWISTDNQDTLEFTSVHDLYKMITGVKDHYDYSLTGDSILITYNGLAMPYIYLGPSKNRFYQLNGNDLTIDFRNAYYGFSNQIILFHRK